MGFRNVIAVLGAGYFTERGVAHVEYLAKRASPSAAILGLQRASERLHKAEQANREISKARGVPFSIGVLYGWQCDARRREFDAYRQRVDDLLGNSAKQMLR